jgi:hypothetical protein
VPVGCAVCVQTTVLYPVSARLTVTCEHLSVLVLWRVEADKSLVSSDKYTVPRTHEANVVFAQRKSLFRLCLGSALFGVFAYDMTHESTITFCDTDRDSNTHSHRAPQPCARIEYLFLKPRALSNTSARNGTRPTRYTAIASEARPRQGPRFGSHQGIVATPWLSISESRKPTLLAERNTKISPKARAVPTVVAQTERPEAAAPVCLARAEAE